MYPPSRLLVGKDQKHQAAKVDGFYLAAMPQVNQQRDYRCYNPEQKGGV